MIVLDHTVIVSSGIEYFVNAVAIIKETPSGRRSAKLTDVGQYSSDKAETDKTDKADVNSNAQPDDPQAQVWHKSDMDRHEEDLQKESDTNTEKLTPEQEAEVVTVEIKLELRNLFGKSGKFIERLGIALKKIVKRERDTCEEIKTRLKDEIAEGIISARTIELHCPEEWKHKTKPTRKNEKISFSKQVEDKPQHKVVVMQAGKSATVTEKEVGTGLDTSSPQSERDAEAGIDINSDTTASMSYNSFDNSKLSEEEKERKCHRKCENCERLQQKCEELQSKLEGYRKALRIQTPIKTAKELMYAGTDGCQQFEFPVPFEQIRRHMVYFNGIDGPLPDSVWFNGKFNHRTGKVIDARIGRTTDTDITDVSRVTP
jgi:hypothetical protein